MKTKMDAYYAMQANKERYLDALVTLAVPKGLDVVLDVGTGSGTVSFFLGSRVKKIFGIDPNEKYIQKNREEAARLMTKALKANQHCEIEFLPLAAEEIESKFPEAFFDTVVCWGSVHHFRDCQKAMQNIRRVSKPRGNLIIFDAFFPEQVRDVWELASTIHDPTTVRHHTYFEYMEMLRDHDFYPKTILPFRHINNLDTWLDTIDEQDEPRIANLISILHPGKYDRWLDDSRKEGIGLKKKLRREILDLEEDMKALMSIRDLEDGQYEFTYDTFVLLAQKGE